MPHDPDKQPDEKAHARGRQDDEQQPCARKARPRRAVVVHARELQKRRQEGRRLPELHHAYDQRLNDLVGDDARKRREGKADRLALAAPVKAQI